MSVPSIINDGDFASELQNGGIVLTCPLADRGDFNHLVMRRKRRVDVASFKPSNRTSLAPVSAPTADGPRSLLLVGMTDPDIPGNNLIEWEDIYATVPAQRTEPTSITYTMQFLQFEYSVFGALVSVSIGDFTDKRPATIVYDYFLKGSELPTLRKPKLETFGGRIFSFGGWRLYLDGEDVLAEDSVVERYIGDIFVRKSIYIKWVSAIPFTPTPP